MVIQLFSQLSISFLLESADAIFCYKFSHTPWNHKLYKLYLGKNHTFFKKHIQLIKQISMFARSLNIEGFIKRGIYVI